MGPFQCKPQPFQLLALIAASPLDGDGVGDQIDHRKHRHERIVQSASGHGTIDHRMAEGNDGGGRGIGDGHHLGPLGRRQLRDCPQIVQIPGESEGNQRGVFIDGIHMAFQ